MRGFMYPWGVAGLRCCNSVLLEPDRMGTTLVGQRGKPHTTCFHFLKDEDSVSLHSCFLFFQFFFLFLIPHLTSLLQKELILLGPQYLTSTTARMSLEDTPDIGLGYGFEDDQTRLQLELIDDLQKLGVSEYIYLPQASPPSPCHLHSMLILDSLWWLVSKAPGRALFFKP